MNSLCDCCGEKMEDRKPCVVCGEAICESCSKPKACDACGEFACEDCGCKSCSSICEDAWICNNCSDPTFTKEPAHGLCCSCRECGETNPDTGKWGVR